MRFDKHKLEDDNEELRELLTQEEDRSESLEKTVNDNLARAEDAEAHAIDLQTDLQAAEQELSILRVRVSPICRVHELTIGLLRQKLMLYETSQPIRKSSLLRSSTWLVNCLHSNQSSTTYAPRLKPTRIFSPKSLRYNDKSAKSRPNLITPNPKLSAQSPNAATLNTT